MGPPGWVPAQDVPPPECKAPAPHRGCGRRGSSEEERPPTAQRRPEGGGSCVQRRARKEPKVSEDKVRQKGEMAASTSLLPGVCGSPCKKLPQHKRSGRAGHANRSSPARGRCVLREAEIWGDECFGTGCTCASTAFAKVPSKTDGHAGKQLRLHRHSVETPPAIRRGTSVVSRVVLQR